MKINRNDACLCGSEKKYKHCCGSKSSGNESNQMVRGLILSAILVLTGLTIYAVFEDRPEMEIYECGNPNCEIVHFRPVSSPTENN